MSDSILPARGEFDAANYIKRISAMFEERNKALAHNPPESHAGRLLLEEQKRSEFRALSDDSRQQARIIGLQATIKDGRYKDIVRTSETLPALLRTLENIGLETVKADPTTILAHRVRHIGDTDIYRMVTHGPGWRDKLPSAETAYFDRINGETSRF